MSDASDLMTAKTVVLEILVRALFRDMFLRAENPIAAFDSYSSRLSSRLEAGMLADGAKEGQIAWIMVSEQLNRFLDQLRHELQQAHGRGSQAQP